MSGTQGSTQSNGRSKRSPRSPRSNASVSSRNTLPASGLSKSVKSVATVEPRTHEKRRGSNPEVNLANSGTWRELLNERGTTPEYMSPQTSRRARSPTWTASHSPMSGAVRHESPSRASASSHLQVRLEDMATDKYATISPGSHRKDRIMAAGTSIKNKMKSAQKKSGRIRSKTQLNTPEKKEEREIKKRETAIQKAKAKAAKEAKARASPCNNQAISQAFPETKGMRLLFEDRTILEQGYLKERMPSGKWRKRWAILDQTHLILVRDIQEPETNLTTISLVGSACRPQVDKTTSFELFGPAASLVLMADSPKEMFVWVNAISQVCESQTLGAIDPKISERLEKQTQQHPRSGLELSNDSPAEDENPLQSALLELLALPSNNLCADCDEPEPEWASINLGSFICIQCSGIHRALGTHISKVRSVYLDKWKEEDIEVMVQNGNAKVNAVYEFSIPKTTKKPTPDSPSLDKERWIHSKYVQKRFTEDAPLLVNEAGLISIADLKHVFLSMLENDQEFRKQVRDLLLDDD